MSDAHLSSLEPEQLEALATRFEESELYRLLRRITPRAAIVPLLGTPTRPGIFLDLEITGLELDQDEIIEMAMVPFTYGIDSTLYSVEEPFRADSLVPADASGKGCSGSAGPSSGACGAGGRQGAS
jgi:DNA polymerase-3 subunit epsilon